LFARYVFDRAQRFYFAMHPVSAPQEAWRMQEEPTDRKFDPTVLARPANCGGCAPIQGLQVLRAGAFCSSGRSIRNARSGIGG